MIKNINRYSIQDTRNSNLIQHTYMIYTTIINCDKSYNRLALSNKCSYIKTFWGR